MSFDITTKIIDAKNGKAFVVFAGDIPVIRSDRSNYTFLGDYGTYASTGEAQRAALEMISRNRSFLRRVEAADTSEGIRVMQADKYMKTLKFFQDIYRQILADKADDSYNNLDRTVPILKQMIEDTAGPGGQIDLVISEIENSTRMDYEPEEDGAVDREDATHQSSKHLVEIRDVMREILSILESDYSEFIEASSKSIKKYASSHDIQDIFGEIVRHYVNCACESCGMENYKIEDARSLGGDMGVVCNAGGRRVMVLVGGDLCYRGIIPINGDIHPYSMRHYVEMIRPSLSRIGHMRPMGHNVIMKSNFEVLDGDDICSGYDVSSGEEVSVAIKPVGGKLTKSPSFSYSVNSIKSASYDAGKYELKEVANKISESPLIMVDKPGSRYDGMAGTADPERIVFRNDHIEFPISLEFDNGMHTELWVTNEEVKAYR